MCLILKKHHDWTNCCIVFKNPRKRYELHQNTPRLGLIMISTSDPSKNQWSLNTVDGSDPSGEKSSWYSTVGSFSHYLQDFKHPRWWSPDFFHHQYLWANHPIIPQPECFGHFGEISLLFTSIWIHLESSRRVDRYAQNHNQVRKENKKQHRLSSPFGHSSLLQSWFWSGEWEGA